MPGAHKIGATISGPRITGGNFMDTTLFLNHYEDKAHLKPILQKGPEAAPTQHNSVWRGHPCPKGPKIEKIQSQLKISISLEIFNPDLQNSPQKIGVSLTLQSLLFSISLLFFVFRFSLLFCAFFLPFPRILGVPRGGKPLLFWGKTLAFSKKARVGGSGLLGVEIENFNPGGRS